MNEYLPEVPEAGVSQQQKPKRVRLSVRQRDPSGQGILSLPPHVKPSIRWSRGQS